MLLLVLFASLSGLAVTLLYALCPSLTWWWHLPLWLGTYVAIGVVYILLLVCSFLWLPKADPSPRTRHITHRLIEWTLAWVLLMLGYCTKVEGRDKLPHRPYLLVCNHRSAFDPLCTVAALTDVDMVFVAKPGVFRIPVIGTILHRLCFLPIDRENARNAVTTIKRAAELVRDVNLCVGIYPEGTRNKTGDELLPFHAGSFKIAKLAGCPIVVATIRYEKHWLGKVVHLNIVDVMEEAFVEENNTATLSDRAKEKMEETLL
ncbi:MAG: 1-acyl-sn-glycerol-3-phosphate acyltransferase [Clostridia bacterium]|nr:1-acyl-sn-glycerol-3-phosphate acyltransferase [Clostridia bacterium]